MSALLLAIAIAFFVMHAGGFDIHPRAKSLGVGLACFAASFLVPRFLL